MSFERLFPRKSKKSEHSFNDFQTLQVGEGSFGKVFKAIHKHTHETYAIKQISKSNKNSTKLIQHELDIMYALECDHIVRLYDHFQTGDHVFLVLEYVDGQQLYQSVISKHVRLSGKEIARIIYELCKAVLHVHSRKILHRDIKPQNVMMDRNGRVKLTDFGTANYVLQNEKRTTYAGTLIYMSPEVVVGESQTAAVDVWAIGVMLYEMATLEIPFKGVDQPSILGNVKTVNYRIPNCLEKQEQLKDLIKRTLLYNPKERLKIREVMEHPWIKSQLGSDYKQVPKEPGEDEVSRLDCQWRPERKDLLNRIEILEQLMEEEMVESHQQKLHLFEAKIQESEKKMLALQESIGKRQELVAYSEVRVKKLRMDVEEGSHLKQNYQKCRVAIQEKSNEYRSEERSNLVLQERQTKLSQEMQRYNNRCEVSTRVRVLEKAPSSQGLASKAQQKEDLRVEEESVSVSPAILKMQELLASLREKRKISTSQNLKNIFG